MFKSIFWKQFVIYMGIMLISLVALSAATSQAFARYFISQKEKLLTEQGQTLAGIVCDLVDTQNTPFGAFAFQSRLNDSFQYLQDYLDSSVLIVDRNFKISWTTPDLQNMYGAIVNEQALLPVMNGTQLNIVGGTLGNIFSTQVLTSAYPINYNGTIIGAVLINSSMPELQQTTSDVIGITLICVAACAVLAFVLIYFLSRGMSKPLLEMNEAAKIIANGDFEKRITVQTRDEVGQLAESFNNMAESLNRQDKSRQEFIANISHDLRTPLTSIRGFLQAILDGTIPPENQAKYLNVVMSETERLTRLANDILDLNKAQLSVADLDREDFDICELLRTTVMMFEQRIREAKQHLNLVLADEVIVVTADYEKIRRVIQNLLDNAIKFTPEQGEILVETTIRDEKLYVKVKDSGRGISEEDKKRIFDRFFKADASRGTDKTGSGLGLAIVRAFINAHEETVWVESEEEKGSEFIFTLPLGKK